MKVEMGFHVTRHFCSQEGSHFEMFMFDVDALMPAHKGGREGIYSRTAHSSSLIHLTPIGPMPSNVVPFWVASEFFSVPC